MLGDLERAISIVNELLSKVPGLTGLDIGEGVLIRIDFCYNYQVGEHVMDYLNAIGQLPYPRRTRIGFSNNSSRNCGEHRNNGVKFHSKQIITTFYDKHSQFGDPNAFGLLRHEVSIRDQSRIRELFGKPPIDTPPTLRNVTPTIVKAVLHKDLEVLGLDKGIITNQTEALNILQNTYGKQKGYKLMEFQQFLRENTSLSKPELAAKRDVKPRTINRWLKEIRDAGLVPAIPMSNITLPPLKVEMEEGE
jgi:hypothetical protein